MRKTLYVILWFLVLLSLALNIIILAGLWKARQTALEVMDEGLEAVARLEEETFSTTVRVQQRVPVSADVPFNRTLTLPVNVSVPISHDITFQEDFELSIDTPLGEQSISIPVSATIPLSLTIPVAAQVPVNIDETIAVRTDVEIDTSVPVAIRVADTPLLDYLEQMETMLAKLRQQLTLNGQ